MVVIRRNLIRLFRLRSLLTLTSIIVLLYLIKALGYISSPDIALHSKEQMDELQFEALIQEKGYFVPSSLKKIDWHMQDKIRSEKMRIGLGEHGLPAEMPKGQKELEDKLYSENGYNGALSDLIALNRSVPDIRHPKCKDRKYIESLPTVSVVVPFHNEHWSTLLRTVYSVINRSPEHLIKEIFLVDDASSKDFLKSKLDDYLKKYVPKASVIRLKQRSGLITARLAGARQSTGDVLIFLDSHTEANVNWLPPLLEPIALNHRVVVCPFIDVVAYDTFEYRAQDEGARGAFDWEFFYKRLPLLPKDLANMPEPFESPVMAGGLFAISRSFFWELGGYDPGLDIWGGEQYEISFKIWQCGGRLVDAACSRVGHIFRRFAPFPNPGHGDFVGKNYRRVAEVWMDEYAEYLYMRRPHYRKIDPGDLIEQKKLKWKLKCKPFNWFMTQIAFDLTANYPPIEPKPFAEGHISPASHPQLCVDAHNGEQNERLQLTACGVEPSTEQLFVLSYHKDVRSKRRTMCWDLPDSKPKSPILLYGCHLGGGNQLWRYHPDTKKLTQGSGTNCLDWEMTTRVLYINKCVDGQESQMWNIESINFKSLKDWDKVGVRVTGPVKSF